MLKMTASKSIKRVKKQFKTKARFQFMNLNVTKRTFEHLYISVGKTLQKRENHEVCVFKIALYLTVLNLRLPNLTFLKTFGIYILNYLPFSSLFRLEIPTCVTKL